MDPSSSHKNDRLNNSSTITVDVQHNGSVSSVTAENNNMKGAFVVTSSSERDFENLHSDLEEEELDKSLTLAVYRPTRISEEEGIRDNLTKNSREKNDIKNLNKTSGEMATIDEEKTVASNDDIWIKTADNTDSDEKNIDLETNDAKQVQHEAAGPLENHNRINSNDSCNTDKPPENSVDPVEEPNKANEDYKLTRANRREEPTDLRRVSVSSSPAAIGILAGQVSNPIEFESGKERKHSTGEFVSKNRSRLSLDSPAIGTQSGRMDAQTTPISHEENRLPSIVNTDERTFKNKERNRRKSRGGSSSSCSNNNNSSSNVNATNVTVNRTRCHSSHGARGRNTHTKLQQRNSSISKSYDKSVNILGSYSSSSESIEKRRPVSVFEQRYTVGELRKALPRKSFFSCHEKAMKDAGLETDDPEKKRKAERLKARLERIANEFSPFPSARSYAGNETQGVLNNVVNITINDGLEPCDDIIGIDNEKEGIDTEVLDLNLDSNGDSSNTRSELFGSRREAYKLGVKSSHTTRRRPGSAKPEHIDCKPLFQYLEYVRDNRDEYLHHNNNVHVPTNASHFQPHTVSQLINLGKAFELRHMGGIPRRNDDNVIVMAAKALRPRCSDPAKYTKIERDKSASHRGQPRPPSEDKRKQEPHAKEEEHNKTELEKKRIRAEEWTKSVSTNTLTKAKIQSLRELGADDIEIMKWWDAFKSCRYLRDTGPVEEKIS